MTELERIVDQLERAHNGAAWHGDNLLTIVQGTSPDQANARLAPGTHTIHELVLHIIAWQREVTRRLHDRTYGELSPERDWPHALDWSATLRALDQSHAQLVSAVRNFDPALLDIVVPGSRDQSFYLILHGVVQHTLYHAGQIAIMKKLAPDKELH